MSFCHMNLTVRYILGSKAYTYNTNNMFRQNNMTQGTVHFIGMDIQVAWFEIDFDSHEQKLQIFAVSITSIQRKQGIK